ncbi:MAG: methyltransferase domain-containing protein [Rhodocyclales bacterium]|nr:methyltransferase domain-containing protein [Rhodocyclales bacterium]
MTFDHHQFKRLERAGYDRLGPRYLAAAGTRNEIATALLDAAALAPGQRVLDLASGPGLLARAAAARIGAGGLAIASDISQGQLACCPELLRVAADGEALPFADGEFDRVLCGLGLMFFPDTEAVLREIHRVLRPRGRLAFSVWGRADEVPLVECALACMRRLLPPPKVTRPSIFRFGEAEELNRRLASADFQPGDIHPCRFTLEFASASAYWQAFLDLAGGAAESLSRLPAEKQQALAAGVADELLPHACPPGYRLTSTVLIASTVRS